MTRKQALGRAIELIENEEIKNKLKELYDWFPLNRWTQSAIFDAVDQFIFETGRVPTRTDFATNRNLPPHRSIKISFGFEVKEFLDRYYPKYRFCRSKVYYTKSKEEWLLIFKENYIRIKPYRSDVYNQFRAQGTPGWFTVAKLFGIKTWLGLLSFAGMNRYDKCGRIIETEEPILKVISHNDLLEEQEDTQDMTRKEAIQFAVEHLEDGEAKTVLKNLATEMPLHEWDVVTIFDAVDQFISEHNRVPTPTDFKHNKRLPSGATVQYRMKMTLKEFLDKYYSKFKKCNSVRYYMKTDDEWLDIFIDAYKRLKPVGANAYNQLRDKDTPTWFFYAHLLGISKWNELLDKLGLEHYYVDKDKTLRTHTALTVNSIVDI